MKRIAAVLLAVVLAFSISACGEKVDPEIQKKNEEALAGINKDYIGQYLGDGTYQFEDITYKVNQNWEVKLSPMLNNSNSFSYWISPKDGPFIKAMFDNNIYDEQGIRDKYRRMYRGSEEIISIGEKTINEIECIEVTYTFPLDGTDVLAYMIETFIPCSKNSSLCLSLASNDQELLDNYKSKYYSVISSVKYTNKS